MMGKPAALCRLGLKYLWRYRRRYGFLFLALVFGFGIVTFITSVKDGMYDSVYYSAQAHYAGDIVAAGYDSTSVQTSHMGPAEMAAILESAQEAALAVRHTVKRTQFGERGVIHFNGAAVRLKYMLGVDWEGEAHIFEKLSFEGTAELPAGEDGIFLSAPVAGKLGARLGDSVILEMETRWGQKNTGVFIIRGIVRDASIFGYYKVYVSRLTLNRLMAYGDDDCSFIGFFLENPGEAGRGRTRLQEAMAGRVQAGPLVQTRDELLRETSQPWDGIKIFLYTMPVFLSDVADLLGAMNSITYFLYGMMLIIIMVSAVVTYRLILHERTREIGVMRAIGFYGGDLRLVLWAEVSALTLVSLLAGFVLARILQHLLSLMSFSWFPSFEIFMKDGKLAALYLPETTLVNVVSVFAALFAAVLVPVFRSSRKPLPGLLSGEAL
jgi:ABC-type lipoprotein release transport system permease subunit